MNSNILRIVSAMLALLMIAGVLASCRNRNKDENTTNAPVAESTEGIDETQKTEGTTTVPSEKETTEVGDATSPGGEDSSAPESVTTNAPSVETTEPAGKDTTAPSGNETTETTETDGTSSVEETLPSLIEGENADFIEYADSLLNGVNGYYDSEKKDAYIFENQNMVLTHDLKDTKVVSSIKNKNGVSYIENTMDVFLKMEDDTYYYASNSMTNAIANIFKLGYYYYENRVEGLTFSEGYQFEDAKGKDVKFGSVLRYNKCTGSYNGTDKILSITVTDNEDPWLSFKNINHYATEYNILSVTMKVDPQITAALGVYYIAGANAGSESFTSEQSKGWDIIPDGEYHTYYIPIYESAGYTGKVTGLRLDFTPSKGSVDAKIDISDMRFLKATNTGSPDGVYLNKMFNTYSDKLHQTLQIATQRELEGVKAVGIRTTISADKVNAIVIKDRNGLHYDLNGIAWATAQYIGFDIKDAGIFGLILPYDGSGGTVRVTLTDGVYVIEQTKAPASWTLKPSDEGTRNANDFYMGHRIYTDEYHTFDKFIKEAELEVNPLTAENFIVNEDASTYGKFVGYDPLRGCYTLDIDGTGGFTPPFKLYPNKHFNLTFNLKGDGVSDRKVYILAQYTLGGSLECAAILDGNQMMLPIPLEVGKNFADNGDKSIFNLDDAINSETILPMVVNKDTDTSYSILNLYYNWGKYPLKQISYIQYYAPYYHLSTGVHESNCITPLYFPNDNDNIEVLPDHRPMSGPFQSDGCQHTYCGVHSFLQYTDADGNYYASSNYKNEIGSYGPTYCDVTTHYLSNDGKIKVSYNHMEFPQMDENRAFYEMKYEILEDVSFSDFSRDFSFYSVRSLDPTGLYTQVGYLDKSNISQVATAAVGDERFEYVLGDSCPYFSFFNMDNSTYKYGYSNLSFLIYESSFTIGGEKATPSFLVVNTSGKISLTLDLDDITLKAGDTITINAILMPWQPYETYDEKDPDINVRRVRENTLLKPLTLTAGENCEKIESVFLPKARTTDGKSATFTLSGGHNNVAVRIYGFEKLTAPVIEELVDGEWKLVDISSFSTPDNFGYGNYYDGYNVFYDGDGTYSYSFVTTMDNGAPRTFRVSAAEDFKGWPEIEEVPNPMNIWIDPQKLNGLFTEASARFGEFSMLSEDGVNFLRVNRNGTDKEATLTLFDEEEAILGGRYLVFKFRAPQGTNSKIGTFQFYLGTEHNMYDADKNILIVGEDYCASCPNLMDGKWHVIVIDLEAYGKTESFKKADDGNYYLKYIRFDVFEKGYATDAIIDIAYIGVHDSFEEILEFNEKEMGTVALFEKAGYYEQVSTKNNEALNLHFDAAEIDAMVERYKNRFHSVTLSDNRDYVTFAGSTGAEAIVDLFKGNSKETGKYLVFKYRIPKAEQSPFGYWQFYVNTDGASASSDNAYSCEGSGTQVIANGEWQVIVIDLTSRDKTTFTAVDGKYTANFFRFDFFNSTYGAEVSYDLEYIAFADSLEAILEYNSDLEYLTVSTSTNESYRIDPKTGNIIEDVPTDEPTDKPEDETTNKPTVDPEEETTDKPADEPEENTPMNIWFDSASLNAAFTPEASRFGEFGVMNEDGVDFIRVNRNGTDKEATITLFDNKDLLGGRYLVYKFRTPQGADSKIGNWQFFLATENNMYSDDGSILIASQDYNASCSALSDGKWHVIVIDLAAYAKADNSFKASADGNYYVNYLRFDIFNPGIATDAIVDVAYIAIHDSLDDILAYNEKDMATVTLFKSASSYEQVSTKNINALTYYMDAAEIDASIENLKSRFHSVTLSEDHEYITFSGSVGAEAIADIFKGNTKETGRYFVFKYRLPEAEQAPFGYWQFYTNTTGDAAGNSNCYSCEGDGTMVIADGEWQVLVVDLAARNLGTYVEKDGKYVANYFRFDFFNSTYDAEVTYDIEYMAFSNSLDEILEYNSDLDYVTLSTGQKESVKLDTATGSEITE